jgi:hypothetical protein
MKGFPRIIHLAAATSFFIMLACSTSNRNEPNKFSVQRYLSNPHSYEHFPSEYDVLYEIGEGCITGNQDGAGAPYQVSHSYYDRKNNQWISLFVEGKSRQLTGCLVSSIEISSTDCILAKSILKPNWFGLALGKKFTSTSIRKKLGKASVIEQVVLGKEHNISAEWYFPDHQDPSLLLKVYLRNTIIVALSFEYVE